VVRLQLLSDDHLRSIHETTLDVLENMGLQIKNEQAMSILKDAGCEAESSVVRIPSSLVEECIKKPPRHFDLFSRERSQRWSVGGDNVIYNPGSSVSHFIDRKTGEIRKATAQDAIEIIRLVEGLQFIRAQSTAVIPSDIPEIISDFFRLFLTLKYSTKPIITGAFRKEGFYDMHELLLVGLDKNDLRKSPRAVFDCCPTSPMTWSDITCQNLIDCAMTSTPAEIVPAPLMGATSPITIAGTLVQSNAEIVGGVVISQLVNPGTPVIYGGAPAPLDMRYATPRFGSIEAMLTMCASAELGKTYGIPTHAYLGLSDSKTIDSQLGFESGLGLMLAALSRINIVSGPGALTFIDCQSAEKLMLDNEFCGAAYRLIEGIAFEGLDEIIAVLDAVRFKGDFLKQRHTLRNLRKEHYMPSDLIDRLSPESWKAAGEKSAKDRARARAEEILALPRQDLGQSDFDRLLDDCFKELMAKYGINQNSVISKILSH
jgi:trimethylamine--corrinoid protein Co-methyltransferase